VASDGSPFGANTFPPQSALAGEGASRYLSTSHRPFGVAEIRESGRKRLARRERLTAIALAAGLLVPLAGAAALSPDPRGYGTHQQVGLPPCTFRFLFGCRCPSCGMTTAWCHLVRGQMTSAIRSNTTGTLLGILAMISVPWLLTSAACGRWRGWAPANGPVLCLAAIAALAALMEWGCRL